MTALADFLTEEARRLAELKPTRDALRADWLAAIERLFAQIEGWVRAADPGGVVQVTRVEGIRREQSLGRFALPRLEVLLDTDEVAFMPMSRFVAGRIRPSSGGEAEPTGRVDVLHAGTRAETIYRTGTGDDSTWWLPNRSADLPTTHEPLTKDHFERLLVGLLR